MNADKFNNWLRANVKAPLVMGILNVTPDSFSDGGQFNNIKNALNHVRNMEKVGVDIIDIGGESTRPGAKPISIDEELARVIPVIQKIREKSDIAISIDTQKSRVAEAALLAGANIINDISGFRADNEMISIAREFAVPVIAMHMLGTPQTMQVNPQYSNLMENLCNFFKERIATLTENGIKKHNIILDPGIGFGKTSSDNFEIIRELRQITALGFPVLIGTSRKSFIGRTLNVSPRGTEMGTAATVTASILHGANIIRVHDVEKMVAVKIIAEKILR